MEDRWHEAEPVVALVSGKWVLRILRALEGGPRRHNDLLRAVDSGIRAQTLTNALRRLERAGLVARQVTGSTPPAVSYQLTEDGRSLFVPLAGMARWGREHRGALGHDVPGRGLCSA